MLTNPPGVSCETCRQWCPNAEEEEGKSLGLGECIYSQATVYCREDDDHNGFIMTHCTWFCKDWDEYVEAS